MGLNLSRPFGTYLPVTYPALKRRAILEMSLRDTLEGARVFEERVIHASIQVPERPTKPTRKVL